MTDPTQNTPLTATEDGFCILEVILNGNEECSDYRHVEVNSAFYAHTGLADVLGKNMRELFPNMEDYWPRLYGNVARTGVAVKQEHFFEGLNRWFEVYATRMGNAHSQRVAVVFNDRTLRRQSEQKLRFLDQLADRLRSQTQEENIIEIATELLGKFLGADRCYFVECFPQQGQIAVSRNWIREDSPSIAGSYPLHDFGGLEWWRQYSSGDFAVEDVATDPLTKDKSANYSALGISSYAVQPFRREGERTVVLGVTSKTPRQWKPAELELIDDVVSRVWPMVEQARAEAQVRASETNYREMLGRLPVACYTVDAIGRLTFFNSAAAELWGRQPELMKDVWCGSYRMRDLEGRMIEIEDCAAALAVRTQKSIRGIEALVERPDGTLRHVIPHPDPIFDAQGKCIGLINVIVDVTEQKAAEMKVRENAGFLQSVIGATADCLEVFDLTGHLRWMSDNGMRLMEVGEFGAISGSYWPDFWKDESTRKEVASAIQAATAGNVSRFRGFCPTFAGTPRWWDVIVSPILGSDGKPFQILSVSRDVTALREVENALRISQEALRKHASSLEANLNDLRVAKAASESAARRAEEAAQRFQLLSEVVSLQVWTADIQGGLDFVNRECVDYFGTTDLLGNSWAQYVHPDDLPDALKAWQQSLSAGIPYETKFRLRDHRGEYRWFLSRAKSMRDTDGKVVKWIGSNTDVDELKNVQAAAERANRAKDDFLAALSHELRTPLTPVLMTVAELRLDETLPADLRSQLGMIERNVALEARLIDDLLDLTRISHGKLRMLPEPCDAHSLIGQAVDIVREEARAKNISLVLNYEAKQSEVIVDPARFQQVIWNILRNAVKFTQKNGRVVVHTSQTDHRDGKPWLKVTVTDTGIGIDPIMLDTVFRPFDQGDLKGQHRFGGLGLGLAIARAVVDMHGGVIAAHSEGKGRGATFTVELPRAAAPRRGIQGSVEEIPATSSSPVAPVRILLVEDHETTLRTMRMLLQKDGHIVSAAASVKDALEASEHNVFDLVVSDLGLSDGTGIELMGKLRATYGLKGIALSGYGMEDDLVRSQEAGFIAHLIKPVQFSELRRVIRRVTTSQG